MTISIAQQVADFLKAHPAATNSDLYQTFPKVRENTLRNYKYKFKNSVDQYKITRKKNKTKKAEAPIIHSSSQSLRSLVFDFFKENPKATNQKLYETFSRYSKNKLRHYKASFFKSLDIVSNNVASGLKRPGIIKDTRNPIRLSPEDLESRIAKLEKQVRQLTEMVISLSQTGGADVKATRITAATGIEKKIKELEASISGFIDTKRKKIKTEMSHLEEIQQVVSDKINSFIKGFK